MIVADDGEGFEQTEAFSEVGGHFGLLGMRERAERLGGELDLASQPGPRNQSRSYGAALVAAEAHVRILIAEDHLIARLGVKTISVCSPA